jgi:hypothetical protein
MDNSFNNNNYNALIKKIKTRRLIAAVIYFVSIVISMNICIPSFISIGDRIIFENKGANPIITILVFLLLSFVFLIAVGVILSPVLRAMNEESDPQKYLALAAPFYKNNMDQVYSVAYFYMGNFLGSRFYSEKLSQSKKAKIKLNALFTKASCEFFLNDIETFKNTAMQFKYTLAQEKLKQKDREHFQFPVLFVYGLLLYKFIVYCVERRDEIVLVNTDYNVKLARALIYHSDIDSRVGDRVKYASRGSARLDHAASDYCNKCKSAFKGDAVGLGSSGDCLNEPILVSVELGGLSDNAHGIDS